MDLGPEEEKVYELLSAYRDHVESLNEEVEPDYSLPLAVGENHFGNHSFDLINELLETKDVAALGLEGLYHESDTLEKFNSGNITPQQMADTYNTVTEYPKDQEFVEETFRNARQKNVEIFGLENISLNEARKRNQHTSTEENLKRNKFMIDKFNEMTHKYGGATVAVAGAAHVDHRMKIPEAYLNATHPDLHTQTTIQEIKQKPYLKARYPEQLDTDPALTDFSEQPQQMILGEQPQVNTVLASSPGEILGMKNRESKIPIHMLDSQPIKQITIETKQLLTDLFKSEHTAQSKENFTIDFRQT